MKKYQPIINKDSPLGQKAMSKLRPLFESADFCRYFHIDIDADEDAKLNQLRYYYLEWHSPDQYYKAVEMFDDIMLYRWSRGITGTCFW